MCAFVVRLPFDCNARRLGHLEDAGAHFGRDSRIATWPEFPPGRRSPNRGEAESTADRRRCGQGGSESVIHWRIAAARRSCCPTKAAQWLYDFGQVLFFSEKHLDPLTGGPA